MTPQSKRRAPSANGNAAHSYNQQRKYTATLRPSERILPLLSGVRKTGEGWRANCPNPAHGDSGTRGTLALSEGRDGQLLMHCFSCSDTRGVLAGLGLDLADLYPDRPKDMTPEGRRQARAAFKRNAWVAALGVLGHEATFVYEVAKWLRDESRPLPESDMIRLRTAGARLQDAREVLT